MQFLNFWGSLFSDDSYHYSMDNTTSEFGHICFELESFIRPVTYEELAEEEGKLYDPFENMIKNVDMAKIECIKNKTPFENLSEEDKELLWKYRYALTQTPEIIPKLLCCFNLMDAYHVKELENVIRVSNLIIIIKFSSVNQSPQY
jgi:hypothetical protein